MFGHRVTRLRVNELRDEVEAVRAQLDEIHRMVDQTQSLYTVYVTKWMEKFITLALTLRGDEKAALASQAMALRDAAMAATPVPGSIAPQPKPGTGDDDEEKWPPPGAYVDDAQMGRVLGPEQVT